jgi:hypothetical protein
MLELVSQAERTPEGPRRVARSQAAPVLRAERILVPVGPAARFLAAPMLARESPARAPVARESVFQAEPALLGATLVQGREAETPEPDAQVAQIRAA